MGYGKLSGTSWHIEFHSSPKKDKASKCEFLGEDRICNNKQAYNYLAKCFAANYCKFYKNNIPKKNCKHRSKKIHNENSTQGIVKRAENKNTSVNKKAKIKVGTNVYHKTYGIGTVKNINNGKFDVQFEVNNIKTFLYPSALEKGFIEKI